MFSFSLPPTLILLAFLPLSLIYITAYYFLSLLASVTVFSVVNVILLTLLPYNDMLNAVKERLNSDRSLHP